MTATTTTTTDDPWHRRRIWASSCASLSVRNVWPCVSVASASSCPRRRTLPSSSLLVPPLFPLALLSGSALFFFSFRLFLSSLPSIHAHIRPSLDPWSRSQCVRDSTSRLFCRALTSQPFLLLTASRTVARHCTDVSFSFGSLLVLARTSAYHLISRTGNEPVSFAPRTPAPRLRNLHSLVCACPLSPPLPPHPTSR